MFGYPYPTQRYSTFVRRLLTIPAIPTIPPSTPSPSDTEHQKASPDDKTSGDVKKR